MEIISTTDEDKVLVVKTNGETQKFNPDKIYKCTAIACKDTCLSAADIMMELELKLTKRIKSRDIQYSVIKSIIDNISNDKDPKFNEDSEIVAGRLLNQQVRKDVYGDYNPSPFAEVVKERVRKKYYDTRITEVYTDEELEFYGSKINYDLDDKIRYIGLLQFVKKLLIRDKNDIPIETIQESFMLIPMYIFWNKKNRKKLILNFYSDLSNLKVILSTPICVGVRTKLRMYSSCAGIMVGDNFKAIGTSFKDMYTLTITRSGIGSNMGWIRGLGASIDGGRESHTGIVPILKVQEKVSLSAVQPGSSRGGAITQYYPFFHMEILTILELKNNKGTDDNRVRQSDHAIIFNDFFMKRYTNNEDITLFFMNDTLDLYEHIGMDDFEGKYVELENKRGIKKIKVPAKDIYDKFWIERFGTGRYYKINANEFQKHSAFKVPVYNSNLCTEISLPSFEYNDNIVQIKKGYKPAMDNLLFDLEESGEWFNLYEHFKYGKALDKESDNFKLYKSLLAKPKEIKENKSEDYNFNFYEIFACILAGVNLSKVNKPEDIVQTGRDIVRFLDALIDYQEYSLDAMGKAAKNRRALGISVSGLFHFLAMKGTDYCTIEARNEVHKMMESLYYGCITESIELAKEEGPCHFYNDTKYSDGLLTIDTYNKNVDELVSVDYQYDWDKVRDDLKKYGLRNSTLLTLVPASNSARTVHTTAGIDLPQKLIMSIEDKRIQSKMVLPELSKYKEFYERHNAWDADMSSYYKLIAVMQKFIDQSISVNSYYDYTKYNGEIIPMSKILEDDATALKYGIKSHYYNKTRSDDEYVKSNKEQESTCSGGGCEL